MKNIQLAPTASPPPIVVMTLNPRLTYNKITRQNEILIISCLIHTHFPMDRASPTPLHNQFFCGKYNLLEKKKKIFILFLHCYV